MPNTIDATGLTVATVDEITTDLMQGMEVIYGDDINVDPESPDGQALGLYGQASGDQNDLLTDVYNMFDVDSAYGIGLQRLVALNGLAIKTGTFTTTPVNVTASKALNLPGLDQAAVPPYQVQDANNTWTLVSSYSFTGSGTQALIFQASAIGPINPLINTISVQATPLNGVTAVNNPTLTGTFIGNAEETDVSLRTRHGSMFQLAATGPADAVEAALLSLEDVQDALVVENNTGGIVDGVPAHSIWPIVVGGTPAEIAGAIYSKSSCAGLFGAQSFNVIRPNGRAAAINYDVGLAQRLWLEFGLVPRASGITFDDTLIAQELAAALVGYFKLGKTASIGDIVQGIAAINNQAIVVSPGVSTDGEAFNDTVGPTSAKYFFTVAAGDINIT